MTPGLLKWGLRLYIPNLGAGVWVDDLSQDFRRMRVSMKLRWYNRNYMGTHFGGSLYAMTDPHYMLMLIQILGPEYRVWDQSARIDFIKPGKGRVYADFCITDQDLDQILKQTGNGAKHLHPFEVTVLDQEGSLVARVEKIVYVRKKQ